MSNHHNPWEDSKPWWERMKDEEAASKKAIANAIEDVLMRRAHRDKLIGYILAASEEAADAVIALPPNTELVAALKTAEPFLEYLVTGHMIGPGQPIYALNTVRAALAAHKGGSHE